MTTDALGSCRKGKCLSARPGCGGSQPAHSFPKNGWLDGHAVAATAAGAMDTSEASNLRQIAPSKILTQLSAVKCSLSNPEFHRQTIKNSAKL